MLLLLVFALFLMRLLCVDRSNDPNQGTFYDTTTTASDAIFNSIVVSSASSSYQTTLVPTASTTSDSTAYNFGDRIVAANGNSSFLYNTGLGYLSIPGRDQQSKCSRNKFAEYRRAVGDLGDGTEDEGECVLYTSSLSTECSSVFDASVYGNDIWVGKTPQSVPTTSSGYVLVSLSAVWIYDSTAGTYTYNGRSSVPTPTYDSSSCTCNNALRTVVYTLNHTTSGSTVSSYVRYYVATDTTTSPTLSPTVDSSPTISPSTTSPSTTTSNPTTTPTAGPSQTTTSSPTTATAVSRGLEPLPKSGNPGYRNGFPVITGAISIDPNSTNEAIGRFLDGLVILGHSTSGDCTTTPSQTTRSRQHIRFNTNTLVGCKLSLTLDDLASICSSGLESYFNTSASHIAQWGNSSFLNTAEWKAIEYDTYSSASAAWAGNQVRKCTGIVSSVHWQFLTKRSGSVLNPQLQIVRVRVKYGTSNWQFQGTNTTDPEDFPLYGTAEFYSLDDQASNTVPTSPPLFPKLPHDTLYPLYTNGE
eukprot:jgi/Bigna1/90977/estExt_fgenesh1_pg.C_840073